MTGARGDLYMQVYISNKEIAEIAEGLVRQFSGGSPPEMVDIDLSLIHI